MTTTRLKLPQPVAPMLASASEPPSSPGWAFEFKWDGVRAIAAATGDQVRLHSRTGSNITGGYPELAVLSGLVGDQAVLLDGEIVALDDAGRPVFGLLQQRMHVRSPSPKLVARVPISYYVFDLLDLDGRRLLPHSYQRRRDLLADLGLDGKSPRVRVPPHHTDVDGHQLLQVARQHGVEGVVGKRLSSRYQPGRRSPAWTKTALLTTHEVVIGGWTTGQGRHGTTLGALLLGPTTTTAGCATSAMSAPDSPTKCSTTSASGWLPSNNRTAPSTSRCPPNTPARRTGSTPSSSAKSTTEH